LLYQLETALNVVSPLVMLAWGAAILVIAVAFFLPLVKLILGLS
jgi:type II secretory pathway component PulF